jgi:hypothetical protein
VLAANFVAKVGLDRAQRCVQVLPTLVKDLEPDCGYEAPRRI